MIDNDCVNEYLDFINSETIDKRKYTIVKIAKTDKSRFKQIENSILESKELEYLAWDRKKNVTLNKSTLYNN